MSFTSGARLGAYEIVALIGAGGMGEVYRARDTRLGRDVAIKVISDGFSADSERMQRFEQEARAAAALNHPNILAVYDIGQAPSTSSAQASAPFIVSELLEGETLRDKLGHGPLPVRKAIELGIQIARGLAAAHDKSIVHRDLKPENIFITNDGRAKILDFGLAKLTQPEGGIAGASNLPTTPVQTQHGMVLGTLGYMAPEQVRGLTADHRADIFSFGAVLYEMLSGRRAFKGDTTADTMSAILKEDPPDLPIDERHIPPALGRIIDRCLEKNPAARFSSAGDLGFALDALSSHSGMAAALSSGIGAPRVHARTRERIAWAALAVCLAALTAAVPLVIPSLFEDPRPPQVVRFSFSAPGDAGVFGQTASISPDGKHVAFVALDTGTNSIWIRSLDSFEARPLPGTEGGQGGFWSPDSRFVGFFADGKLKKIELAGGPSQELCNAPGNGGAGAWSHDGIIIFSRSGATAGVFRVPASGGQSTLVAAPPKSRGEFGLVAGTFLPRDRRFLYTALPAGKIYLGSLDGASAKELTNSTSKALYVAPGYLVFARQDVLMAQPFDATREELSGDAVPIAQQMGIGPAGASFSISDTNALVYRTGGFGNIVQTEWFDRSGKSLGTIGERSDYRDIDLSPDGTRIVVHRHEDPVGGGLWVLDTVRGTNSRLTFGQSHDTQAHWSADGTRVVFGSNREGGLVGIYQKISSAAGPDEPILKMGTNLSPSDWSRDGRFLVYEAEGAKTLLDIWVLPLAGDRKPIPFLQTESSEGQGRLSPDSRWMAYVSNETGKNEVYVQPFPPNGAKSLISTKGGVQPRWRRDGKELFYLGPGAADFLTLTAVDVTASASEFIVGSPRPLFGSRFPAPVSLSTGLAPNSIRQSYAPTADGKKFAVLTRGNEAVPTGLSVVLNWTAALKK